MKYRIINRTPMPKKPKTYYKDTIPKSLQRMCHKNYLKYLNSRFDFYRIKKILLRTIKKIEMYNQ